MSPRALLTLAIFALPSWAEAQSFDCRYARYADEITICEDPMLGRLDERMSRLFYDVRASVWGRERACSTRIRRTGSRAAGRAAAIPAASRTPTDSVSAS